MSLITTSGIDAETPISYGWGDIGRIYERLRKRSYRAWLVGERTFWAMHDAHGSDAYEAARNAWDVLILEDSPVPFVSDDEHAAYVAGVKDALAAIQAELTHL